MKTISIPAAIPIVITAAILVSGCLDSKPNVDIETRDKINPLFGIPYVQVKARALDDNVTVEDIIVNRGNCKIENVEFMSKKPILPKTLKFGESVSVSFSGPCQASQVDVVTNKGRWSQSY